MRMVLRGSTAPFLVLVMFAVDLAAQAPPEANRMQATHAPTPFSAAEIREDCAAGAWRTFRLESRGPSGWEEARQTMRFLEGGPEQTEVEVVVEKESGVPGEPQRQTTTWKDLQAHASFPQHAT